jgi:ACS family hexuronate transporter-like MFS transporter
MPSPANAPSKSLWKWGVCGLLLLATMINYMDRLTLNQVAKRIKVEFANNDNNLYGNLEMAFGLAFAVGSVATGLVVDRFGSRLVYPLMVTLWSGAGFATGFARNYEEILLCRTLLGFFEGANWPCALYTTQRILPAEQRAMGNGILQSGVSVGAIITPLIVAPFLFEGSQIWRYPFMIIGAIGLVWVVLWLALIRPTTIPTSAAMSQPVAGSSMWDVFADRRFWVLAFVVVAINATWHFFRAWMPLFLQEQHGYREQDAIWFSSAYYAATDLGSLAAGALTLVLVRRGHLVHGSRMTTFLLFSILTLSTFVAARLPRGWPLLAVLLVIGFGALGVFPMYYSFTQELSARHQGKVTGSLGFICWVAMAALQKSVGVLTKHSGASPDQPDYTWFIAFAGVPPILAFFMLLVFWPRRQAAPVSQLATAAAEPEAAAAPS